MGVQAGLSVKIKPRLGSLLTHFTGERAMKYVTVVILAWVLLSATGLVLAGDAAAGKAKSSACAACHGAEGISNNDLWPSLAGQKEAYLVKQMKAFRDGSRKDPMMEPLAKPLSDADIDNLSAFYSGLK